MHEKNPGDMRHSRSYQFVPKTMVQVIGGCAHGCPYSRRRWCIGAIRPHLLCTAHVDTILGDMKRRPLMSAVITTSNGQHQWRRFQATCFLRPGRGTSIECATASASTLNTIAATAFVARKVVHVYGISRTLHTLRQHQLALLSTSEAQQGFARRPRTHAPHVHASEPNHRMSRIEFPQV